MDAVLVRLLESVARPITLALVHSLWQGGIIAGIVGATLVALRRKSAALRYAVACIGLLAILASSVATAVWFVHHPEPPPSPEIIWRRVAAAGGPVTGDPALDTRGEPATPASLDAASSAEQDSRDAGPTPGRTPLRLATLDMDQAGPWVFSGWVVGVLLLGVLHMNGWRRARALARIGTSAVPREWRERLRRLSRLVGLARSVELLASTRVNVPTVVGWLRPIVLVPAASLTEMTASDLELIIIHELAHIRRHDVLINYIQAAAETLLFYHPAVWWISRRIRAEREHCCDDLAVIATGDGVAYARALSEVENMRERIPVHAMAADGGAFRDRIRRLIGAAPSGASPRRAGLAGVLVVTLVLGLSVPSLTASPAGDASAKAPEPEHSRWEDIEGEWRAEGFGGQIRLHFDLPSWGECSMTFSDDSFDESGDAYRLERDAGTFILEGGRIPRKWRRALFRPDPAYASAMAQMGYEIEKEKHLLELAIHEITLEFARGIADAGFDIPRGKLVEFRIHDVTPEYVRGMAEAGYDQLTPSRIVEFAIHDIDPEYVKRLAAVGYEEMTPSRMVEFAIHDIDPEYVERLATVGFEDIPPSRIIEFAIHDIDPEYVERLAKLGYEGLTPSKIIEFGIHDIDAEFVERMAGLGFKDLTPSRIIELSIHGVDAEYVERMAAVGYEHLTPSRIIEFRIHGIDAEFIQGLMEVGYGDLSPGRVVEFRIHDVTPEFIRDLADHGITGASPKELVEYRITGIPWKALKRSSKGSSGGSGNM